MILIAALFIIGDGLVRTGVATKMGAWLVSVAGNSETKMLIYLMLTVAGLGAFMSSTGVVAIFIPVVLSVSARMNTSAIAADDAAELRRAYQRDDDPGGDAAQPGGQQ
ncbi:transport protein [Klebsiella pneumoniae subsp. ozaenae]|uniref:Transport protein n=1 Tax=Klebsiella pneumoniae subsp. ozaenae TaxID=574 RepID=A0A378A4L4_KLEPO|nr:transport protein [Klebsiella pneumoniae subsp. ozaenae]